MKYGIVTSDNISKFNIGTIYILKDIGTDLYLVLEGNCDAVRKDCVTLIRKEEYGILRKIQNELLENISIFSEDTQEYIETFFTLKHKLETPK